MANRYSTFLRVCPQLFHYASKGGITMASCPLGLFCLYVHLHTNLPFLILINSGFIWEGGQGRGIFQHLITPCWGSHRNQNMKMVMERKQFANSHGHFEQSWNFTNYGPRYYQICTHFADIERLVSLESSHFSTTCTKFHVENAKSEQRNSHGKCKNSHGKVMEISVTDCSGRS